MLTCISYKKLEKLLSFWAKNNYSKKVELAALEPLLYKDEDKDISSLCALVDKYKLSCSLTTNGFYLAKYAHKLRLEKIRVSLHSMDKEVYKQIMGYDGFELCIKGIKAALKAGLNVAINRVLLAGYTKDLREQIEFVDKYKIKLKLLDLYYTKDIEKQYELYYISPEDALHELIADKTLSFSHLDKLNRDRVVYKTKKGAFVEYKKKSSFKRLAKACLACDKKANCLEGYADYLRVFPNDMASFCYMRQELDFPCFDKEGLLILEKNELFKKLPLRLCVSDTCNYHCGFPGDEKSWCLKKFRPFNYLAKRA